MLTKSAMTSSEKSDKEEETEIIRTKDIADEIGFESISSMLPSFSSSKLVASNTRKTRAARPSKFRNPVRNTMRTKKAKGKYPSALTEEKRYKSLGLSSTSTQILRENRSANNSGEIEKFNPQFPQRRKRRDHLKLSEIPTLANIQIGRKEYHLLVKQKCQ